MSGPSDDIYSTERRRKHELPQALLLKKTAPSATKYSQAKVKVVAQKTSTLKPLIQSAHRTISTSTEPEQRNNDAWKQAIQRYITFYNQTETDLNVRALQDSITDELHQVRLEDKLSRLRNRDLMRAALPAGSETKAEMVRINESNQEISVQLKLFIKRKIEQSGQIYIEERHEHERIWLTLSEDGWIISKVEPIIHERRPRYGQSIVEWNSNVDDEYEKRITPATPFLNVELMPKFRNGSDGNRQLYRRDLAAAYADRWWNEPNPAYEHFDVNCTHYVSQCIFAGNVPMIYTNRRDSGWWYKGRSKGKEWWSYSWAVSNALATFLAKRRSNGLRAEEKYRAEELELGDVIAYDWNGNGRFEHSTIVTAFDAQGQPLVNANTVSSRHRYWDYQDSYAWTPQTKYRFFHIVDFV